MKNTVIQMLRDASAKFNNSSYIVEKEENGWVPKTHQQVLDEASFAACSLLEMGITKNDCISILSEGRSNWVVGEYSILMAGGISVPLSIKLQPEEIIFRINHSKSKAIILSHNTLEKIIPIWNKIEIPHFQIIYFDNDHAYVEEQCKKSGINFCTNVLYFSDLVSTGKSLFPSKQKTLLEIEQQLKEDDVVTICYTSGTTGNPKGIMLTHLNYVSNSTDAMNYFDVKQGFRLLIILPLDHSFAHTVGIYASLVRGLSIYFVDARGGSMATLKNIPINLKEVSPHFLLTVPALSGNFMNKITDGINDKGGIAKFLFKSGMNAGYKLFRDGHHKGNFFDKLIYTIPYAIANKLVFSKVRTIFGTNLKYCVGGGALLDVHQQHFFYSLGIPIFQGYGLTEATPIISANTPQLHKLGTSGGVIPNIQCRIVKTDGSDAKVGEKGEIVIKGKNVMKGYYLNPKASEETLRNGWLYSGDLGYYDKDGFLMVVGREKALLISQDGEKYSPEEIEEAITNCSGLISQIMLYNDHKKYTTAIVTLNIARIQAHIKHHKITTANELIEAIQKAFFQFKHDHDYKHKFQEKWIPSTFRIIEEPFSEQNKMINSTLKMVRHKITEVYLDDLNFMYTPDGSKISNEKNLQILKKLFEIQ